MDEICGRQKSAESQEGYETQRTNHLDTYSTKDHFFYIDSTLKTGKVLG